MSKLYIDGKLVGECVGTFLGKPMVIAEPTGDKAADLHQFRECRTLPTYFCEHCAREAMALAGVEVADPNG